MPLQKENRLMGTLDQLAPYFAATRQNDIFMVGIDLTDLSLPGGAAILLSGDDGFYAQISEGLPVTSLSDLAAVFRAAGKRIEAMNRSPGRRAIPRDVPQEMSDRDLGERPGLAARRAPFAIIRTSRIRTSRIRTSRIRTSREVGNDSLFHLLITDKTAGWRTIFSASSLWLERLAAVTEDAGQCLSGSTIEVGIQPR